MEGAAFPIERGLPAYTPWIGDHCHVSHISDVGLTMRPSFLTQEVKREVKKREKL
jgi:hypothetical protein